VNFPTPGSSWPGQGRTPAPTAPPRQARAREINTRNDRPRDGHRSLADDYRRTHIPPPGTNAHDIIQGYFVDVIAQVIRLRLNAHGNLDHAGRVQSRTKPSGGPAFVASRAVSRCSPTEPASRPRLGAGGAAKSLPVQNRKAPRQLSVHRNLGTDPRPARLLRGRPQAAPARASGARRARRAERVPSRDTDERGGDLALWPRELEATVGNPDALLGSSGPSAGSKPVSATRLRAERKCGAGDALASQYRR
jgi:hypothetical protein